MTNKYEKLKLAVNALQRIEAFEKDIQTDLLQIEGCPTNSDGQVWRLTIPALEIPLLEFSGHWNNEKKTKELADGVKLALAQFLEERKAEYKEILTKA